jgi:predicted signal transduction protein with EAL and GGDEF domain
MARDIHRLQSRMLALFLPVLAGLLAATLWLQHASVQEQVHARAAEGLRAAADGVVRQLQQRGAILAKAARVLAEDPGLRRALVGADLSQARTELGGRARRFGANLALLVSRDGRVLLDTLSAGEPGDNFPCRQLLDAAEAVGGSAGYLVRVDRLYQTVLAPVPGADGGPAAWLALGYALGDADAGQWRAATGADAHVLGLEAGGARLFASSLQDPEREAARRWSMGVLAADGQIRAARIGGREYWARVLRLESSTAQGFALAFTAPANAAPALDWIWAGSLVGVFALALPLLAYLARRLAVKMDSERARREALAYRDPLTGMANRAGFVGEVTTAITPPGKPGVLLVASLARLGAIRDLLGAELGDALLDVLARRVLSRGDWYAACLGGDAFAFFCAVDDAAGVDEWEMRVRTLLEVPVDRAGQRYDLGLFLGSARFPEDGDSAETLLHRAEVARDRAIPNVGAHVAYAPEFEAGAARRRALLDDLASAIEGGQLRARFQPRVRIADGGVVACAMRVGWKHPEHGYLDLGDFLPVAEQSALIQPLTRWIVDTAVARAADWHARGRSIAVVVRLSARNLADHEVVELLAGALTRHGLPPEALVVEVVGDALADDPETAVEVVNAIATLGVRLVLADIGGDDFSLARLARLPVSGLVIPRVFVTRMLESATDAAIVRAIVDLAHALGMCAVADGVDCVELWGPLGFCGCDLAQGAYLSEPLEADALDAWLTARNS